MGGPILLALPPAKSFSMEPPRQVHLLLPEGTRVVTRTGARCVHGAETKPPGAVGVVFPSRPTVPTLASCASRTAPKPPCAVTNCPSSSITMVRKWTRRRRTRTPWKDCGPLLFSAASSTRAPTAWTMSSPTPTGVGSTYPANLHWSLFGAPEQLEDKQNQDKCQPEHLYRLGV